MTMEQFIELANGAAWELEKFAQVGCQVTDNFDFRWTCAKFVAAQEELLRELEGYGVEIG